MPSSDPVALFSIYFRDTEIGTNITRIMMNFDNGLKVPTRENALYGTPSDRPTPAYAPMTIKTRYCADEKEVTY